MDLSTILETGFISGIMTVGLALLSMKLLLGRVKTTTIAFCNDYVSSIVDSIGSNDEFRQKLTEPIVHDAITLLMANKDLLISEMMGAIQKQMGTTGGGNIKIGGLKIPSEAIGILASVLGGNVKNQAAGAIAGSLLG